MGYIIPGTLRVEDCGCKIVMTRYDESTIDYTTVLCDEHAGETPAPPPVVRP